MLHTRLNNSGRNYSSKAQDKKTVQWAARTGKKNKERESLHTMSMRRREKNEERRKEGGQEREREREHRGNCNMHIVSIHPAVLRPTSNHIHTYLPANVHAHGMLTHVIM